MFSFIEGNKTTLYWVELNNNINFGGASVRTEDKARKWRCWCRGIEKLKKACQMVVVQIRITNGQMDGALSIKDKLRIYILSFFQWPIWSVTNLRSCKLQGQSICISLHTTYCVLNATNGSNNITTCQVSWMNDEKIKGRKRKN